MNRKGFGLRAEVQKEIEGVYSSTVIDAIKSAGYSKQFGRLTIHLAHEFGFCYGVDRAVELAYETRRNFPQGKRIFLTTEIIHNPSVNKNLLAMGINFLSGPYQNDAIQDITPDDVVIVPAFGTTVSELSQLARTGCTLVDTICGSVINVWKRVEKYAAEGFTAVIHGKFYHEETMATSSRVSQFAGAHYLVVLSDEEAQLVIDYLLGGGDKEAFLERFKNAASPGFDPDRHLDRLGCANQTTMLSSESLHIANMFRGALVKKFGEAAIDGHFRSFDTICSATQERQDAIIALKHKRPDLIVVVGGYNSSNTTHLQEIGVSIAPSYHIDRAECIIDARTIHCKPLGQKTEVAVNDWLPAGPVAIGITAGASTPNKVMGDVLERVIALGSWG
jgi:4-hydroxy-3-methylbut-2-enyl diphosphate reductase